MTVTRAASVFLFVVTTSSALACDRHGLRDRERDGARADAVDRLPARMITGAGANQSTSPHTGALHADARLADRKIADRKIADRKLADRKLAEMEIAASSSVDAAAGPPDALLPDELLVGEEREREPWSDTIKVKVLVAERRQAHVIWGRRDFGVAPLEIERPRNSGPLDLVVIAPGYLPYHARAFTDRDDTISVHLYSAAEAPQLLGYRASDVPPPAASAPPTSARAPTSGARAPTSGARAPMTPTPASNQNRQKPR